MGCVVNGNKSLFNEGRKPYLSYQVDCWLKNEDPADEDKWKEIVEQLQERAKKRLKRISKHVKKYNCYAYHSNT